MSDIEVPTRAAQVTHQCACILVGRIDFPELPSQTYQDRCDQRVSNPDQPFCDSCERGGHCDLPNQLPMSEPRDMTTKEI
jgi:hypothetical protein